LQFCSSDSSLFADEWWTRLLKESTVWRAERPGAYSDALNLICKNLKQLLYSSRAPL
jgi:hypothetical protein